jgi:hypothetical protein
LKFGLEEKHDVLEFLKKIYPNPLHRFGEKIKSSPTRKFTTHVVTGIANSISLTN